MKLNAHLQSLEIDSLAQLDAQLLAADFPHFELLNFAGLGHRELVDEHDDLRNFEVGHLKGMRRRMLVWIFDKF